jgi:hypothetical protein
LPKRASAEQPSHTQCRAVSEPTPDYCKRQREYLATPRVLQEPARPDQAALVAGAHPSYSPHSSSTSCCVEMMTMVAVSSY